MKQHSNIPKHVAIIMDGNRRWAKQRELPVIAGHEYVVDHVLEPVVDRCLTLRIPYLTLWAFSTENWQRDKQEVAGMMRIFRKGLRRSIRRLYEKGVRLRILGDIDQFPKDIARLAKAWVERSEKNARITVSFGLNYGGRDELLRAVKRLFEEVKSQKSKVKSINEEIFSSFLDTAGMPDPDLIIRTGGEHRLSGFMSWQCAYSELYFTKTLMPDFNPEEFERAIREYGACVRRFGR